MFVACCAGAALTFTRPSAASPQDASAYRNLDTFARALAHIESAHVEPVQQTRLLHGAIRGMVQMLDPHSAFLDPSELRVLTSDTEGRYGGVGIEIDVRDGWLTVVSVFPGQPAELAGVRPGDRFLAIEGAAARDMPLSEAMQRMRGDPGSEVRATIRRAENADALQVVMRRAVIRVQSVEARTWPDASLYLRLRAFNETTVGEARSALERAARSAGPLGLRGLLLDLRDNPGGLLDAAVEIADEFLDGGLIVSTRGRGDVLLREAKARPGTRGTWPMVVLVNGYSASAAEIVAGALQDHRRAVVVGTKTFGKASVQNIIDLPDGSALKLTTARYYTPSGRSIQALGIAPDVEIEQLDARTLAAARDTRDDVREATLNGHLRSQAEPATTTSTRHSVRSPPPTDASTETSVVDDYQLHMARQVLNALVTARSGAQP